MTNSETAFRPGDTVVKKNDLGIPGLTLRTFTVAHASYEKYGRTMVDLRERGARYSRMHPVDDFEVLTDERIEYLKDFHARQKAS